MDTTANPWESAAAASSPTPGTIRGFLYKTIVVEYYEKKVTFNLFFNIYIASPFNAFEFPSGSPQAIGTAPEKSETAALPGIYFQQINYVDNNLE